MGALSPIEIAIIVVTSLVGLLIPVALFWRICVKAGYSGALSLVYLLPVFGLYVLLAVLAFGEWPMDREARLADFPFPSE